MKQMNLKLIVIVIAVLALVGIGLYVSTGVGKAIDTPQPEAIDFDALPGNSEVWTYATVPQFEMIVTTTKGQAHNYVLSLEQKEETELYKYKVTEAGADKATGYFGAGHTSSQLYLDADAKADLSLQWTADAVTIINHNYKEPSPIKINVYKNGVKHTKNIFSQGVDTTFDHIFNITSSKTPSATASIAGQTLTFTSLASGTNFHQYQLNWKPNETDAYILNVVSTVDSDVVTTEYVMAVDDVIYRLKESNVPEVIIRNPSLNIFNVEYIFDKTSELQPFSVPCNPDDTITDNLDDSLISKIFTHTAGSNPDTFTPDVPSDFGEFEANKGYFLKLEENVDALSFTVKCETPLVPPEPGVVPIYSIPKDLKLGYNLKSIGGYQNVPVEDLSPYVPAYKSVTQIRQLQTELPPITEGITELEPGKAYWIYIE